MKAIRRIVYVVALLGLMACLAPFSAAQVVKAENGTAYTPLYRYWSASVGDHVYTTDPSIEALDAYVFEGIQCYVATTQIAGTTPLYRYWSASVGDHVYTTDPSIEALDAYVFERIQCYVATTQIPGTTPLYRYWSASVGDHAYTTDPSIEALDAYVFEGIQCYVWTSRPPVASFTYSPVDPFVVTAYPAISENVTFDGSESSDPEGSNLTYAWDYGDGNTANGEKAVVSHGYGKDGHYLVKLIVTDEHGAPSESYEKTVVVSPAVQWNRFPKKELNTSDYFAGYLHKNPTSNKYGDLLPDWRLDTTKDDVGNTFEIWVIAAPKPEDYFFALFFNQMVYPVGRCCYASATNEVHIWYTGYAKSSHMSNRFVGSTWESRDLDSNDVRAFSYEVRDGHLYSTP